jgi:hypothetical protein
LISSFFRLLIPNVQHLNKIMQTCYKYYGRQKPSEYEDVSIPLLKDLNIPSEQPSAQLVSCVELFNKKL